ncbi:MAG: NAD-dependent epimerase/dehydratase family protein [Elusimicrobiota bacterium]|jgi:nucleoside-diphosphate-sugar epimerase|nr:NAD-dependent epimerase/dehydratase family protein [Elusimicrobiota bacterium]
MSVKKALITGAAGLIGKEALIPLQDAGFEVTALVRKAPNISGAQQGKDGSGVSYIECNLFDTATLKETFQKIQPKYLLHFAWAAKDDYLTSNINFNFLKASLDLLEFFRENGGKRAVFAGTGFEYEFKDEPLKETDPLKPATVYAMCKNYLRQIAQLYCAQNNLSFGWGRIFYVYGRGEYHKRLTSVIINNSVNNRETVINCGSLLRDYLYTKDIACAFVKFLESNIDGIANICSGKGITLADYALLIASKLGKTKYLKILNEDLKQPPIIVGDNKKLTEEIGYKIQYSYETAIDEILQEIK